MFPRITLSSAALNDDAVDKSVGLLGSNTKYDVVSKFPCTKEPSALKYTGFPLAGFTPQYL